MSDLPIPDLVQHQGTNWGWNMGHVNASGQVPDIPNLPSLIDNDTPDEIRNSIRTGFNGRDYQLVFSDEFNTDGRTFYPGDDPFVSPILIQLLPLKLPLPPNVSLLTFSPSFLTSFVSGRLSTCITGKHEIWNGTILRYLLLVMVTSTLP